MAGHRNGRRNDVGLAPAQAPARTEYERDFYSWLMEQARLLREGRFDALDRDNLGGGDREAWGESSSTNWKARCASC